MFSNKITSKQLKFTLYNSGNTDQDNLSLERNSDLYIYSYKELQSSNQPF